MPSTEAPALVPRILAKPQAAAYCGLTESGFDHWVKSGKLPKAMKGTRRWDKVTLDIALDRLSGIDRSAPVPKPSGLAAFMEKRDARKRAEAERDAADVKAAYPPRRGKRG